ncbi:MAG TPA: flagellar biosynthesis protein FlhA [Gammaproteobacteria bacterium]|nr:flagellar biosynthesis protein FlhA [Gammaproteobacteria bacterium]MEC8010370.1 flagellar biosynthesis protein FlhA [Pseudomonadota bacterium]HBF09620.1 flagellar biosynthesis protein FlhA [Gammaproteobacteria bacterium]HCK92129.1 flagellar biosynthesis protein FlhA [Gammaproteobacteria bacterium]|tara:strand:+ start:1004 stop:3124 length:2121 start_codon:yes stop_codon:yes gene_type:complete
MPNQLGVPIVLVLILGMMTLPMPPFLLDMLFTFNIALSLVVLLVSVYTMRPLDFAVFPTILLISTLLRLAMNVASTRVVLMYGHAGGDAAGKVIEAFGEVVIGGDYAVGIVVFAILVIINFVVVTKGAGRISEVSARFTLDAMPGKQMAIDADMNAGLIDQEQAKKRREDVASEADFYGAMDGASKFVRGDAVAGILILIINIIGGLIIGMAQHDLDFSEAMRKYALLTIGDGLVAQIPSLLLSTAAAIMVTRVNSAQDMSGQIVSQMFGSYRALGIASGILILMGIIPGMPHVAFLGFGGAAGYLAYYIKQKAEAAEGAESGAAGAATQSAKDAGGQAKPQSPGSSMDIAEAPKELGWDDVQPVDQVGLEVGYRIIPLVDESQNGALLNRIKGVRKKLSQDLGFLIPSVHIRDNLELAPNVYRITLMGVALSEAEIHPERMLAINPGQVFGNIKGLAAKDPAFGLDAVWIEQSQREQAQNLGYTVVDASTVVATHLNQVLHKHAYELLGHEEVQKLIDQLEKQAPKLVENLTPKPLSLSLILRVLQNILREGIPVRDIRSIAEALAEGATRTNDPDALTAHARLALSRMIVHNLVPVDQELSVMTLTPSLEQLLAQSVGHAKQAGGSETDAIIEPKLAENLQKEIISEARKLELAGKPAVLLASSGIRAMLYRFIEPIYNDIHVIAYTEIPSNKKIKVVASIGQQ